jgi:hypothetical protein
MVSKLAFISAILAASVQSFSTTPVIGNIKDLGTISVSTSFARFWLRGCAGNQPFISGVAMIAPSQGGVFYKDLPADASGNISGNLYSTRDAGGAGDGEILCGTSRQSVWYGLQLFSNGKGGPETAIHARNGIAIDLGNLQVISTLPSPRMAGGDDLYFRLDGSNSSITNISSSEVRVHCISFQDGTSMCTAPPMPTATPIPTPFPTATPTPTPSPTPTPAPTPSPQTPPNFSPLRACGGDGSAGPLDCNFPGQEGNPFCTGDPNVTPTCVDSTGSLIRGWKVACRGNAAGTFDPICICIINCPSSNLVVPKITLWAEEKRIFRPIP